jgi:2-polyprenyl-6-methoxyphenol hydroxylase-like FAD-dependent oxidoreductase
MNFLPRDRWSSGRVGLLGDAAFSSSPLSGQGTGLALVGACLLAGELAAAGWDPAAGYAGYERRMRSFVEANQEIGRLHARSRDVPGPSPDFDAEWFTELIERAQRRRAARLRGSAGLRGPGRTAGHLAGHVVAARAGCEAG